MSFTGSVDDMWSEDVLSNEESTCSKGGNAGNVWNFGGADEESNKTFLHFGLRGIAVTNSDCDKNYFKVFELKEGLTWVRRMEVII